MVVVIAAAVVLADVPGFTGEDLPCAVPRTAYQNSKLPKALNPKPRKRKNLEDSEAGALCPSAWLHQSLGGNVFAEVSFQASAGPQFELPSFR